MKTTALILFSALFISSGVVRGQDLFLTFSGTGASTSVDSVRVENLTLGEKLIIGGSQILHLEQVVTETGKLTADVKSDITFSPNPMNEYSIMEFSVPHPGKTIISIIDLGGKEIFRMNDDLSGGHHSYRVSGIKSGIHLVRVSSGRYSTTGTLVSIFSHGNARAEYINNTIPLNEPVKDVKALKKDEPVMKGDPSEITMHFRDGDSLKFTAASGNYRTIVIDVPDTSKTMTFDFYECSDGDGNNYTVIGLGDHVWMAENLKTTKFNDGTPIRNEKDDSTWASLDNKGINNIPAYCWYNNDENYKDIYGGLYNYPAVYGASGKNVCPAGWHVAAGEWDELFSYLDNAAAPDGEVSSFAGNLIKEEGNMHWQCTDNMATNETWFTALPGGLRQPYFEHLGERAYFWDGSNGKFILYCTSGVVGHIYSKYDYGLSVRCVKDNAVNISFAGTGASTSVSRVKVENLMTGASLALNGDQILHLGHGSGPEGTVFMEYATGQKLKFTGISGNYSTVMVDSLVENKTLTFDFVACTDGDGNNYPVVKIAGLLWMAENLKTTRYTDGTPIPDLSLGPSLPEPAPPDSWRGSEDGYCSYNNDTALLRIYGGLYKLKTLKSGKLCPAGWHAPDNDEWDILAAYLGGTGTAGGMLKETGTIHWNQPNRGATNESGFTALPGGLRYGEGIFSGMRYTGWYWSVSGPEEYAWRLNNGNTYFFDQDFQSSLVNNTGSGFSVRCIHGEESMLPELETIDVEVTATEAKSGGTYVKDHGFPITQKGVCWGFSTRPSINDSHTSDGSGPDSFTSTMTGLTPGTKYYVRAYATNSIGTGYGMSIPFTTKMLEARVVDIDGNAYAIIQIGFQIWMKENLRTARLNDGTSIQLIIDNDMAWWTRHFTGSYFVISYNTVNGYLSYPDPGDKQTGWAVRCLKDD